MWEDLQARREPFAGLIAWSSAKFNLSPGGEARYAEQLYVSGDFFRVLGIEPMGRAFPPDDDRPGCASPGAVVSYAFWSREFGGDPAALGRTLSLDGRRVPVIGVIAPGFFGVEVALGHGPAEAGVDRAARRRVYEVDLAGIFAGDGVADLPRGVRQEVPCQ